MKPTPDNHSDEVEFTTEDRISMVRGAIIGALASGHMEGEYGAEYGKNILLQIADMLDLKIPQNVINGTFRQSLPPLTITPRENED